MMKSSTFVGGKIIYVGLLSNLVKILTKILSFRSCKHLFETKIEKILVSNWCSQLACELYDMTIRLFIRTAMFAKFLMRSVYRIREYRTVLAFL